MLKQNCIKHKTGRECHVGQKPTMQTNIIEKEDAYINNLIKEEDDDDNDSYIIQDEALVTKRPGHRSQYQNPVEDIIPPSEATVKRSEVKIYSSPIMHPLDSREIMASFDPYNPNCHRPALLDDDDQSVCTTMTDATSYGQAYTSKTHINPIPTGYLEMEDISHAKSRRNAQNQSLNITKMDGRFEEPILTSSGLLLTHRKAIATTSASSNSYYPSDNRHRYVTKAATSSSIVETNDEGLRLNNKLQHQQYDLQSNTQQPQHSSESRLFSEGYRKKIDEEASNPYFSNNVMPQNLFHESRYYASGGSSPQNSRGSLVYQLGRILRYARIWVILSALILFFGTFVLIRHTFTSGQQNSRNIRVTSEEELNQNQELGYFTDPENSGESEKIILLPLPEFAFENEGSATKFYSRQEKHHSHRRLVINQNASETSSNRETQSRHDHHVRYTKTLKSKFDSWIKHHKKQYKDDVEREQRFIAWSHNHHRTIDKNRKHGPCKLTGKAVFGSNHLMDLTHEEFQSQFLTGYTGPRTDEEPKDSRSSGVLGPHIPTSRHPDVHDRYLKSFPKWRSHSGYTYNTATDSYSSSSSPNCDWYDLSCLLQYIFGTYIYGWGGTMEPAYDSDSYPKAVDWRSIGAVSDIRSQGSCGACWAITAVETVESATFITTGKLYTLSETEVIVCADDCQMCSGGWPQDAFEYVIEHGGIPLRSDMSYNANWLYKVTAAVAGESDELSSSELSSYLSATCPNKQGGQGGQGGSGDRHSGDQGTQENNDDGSSYSVNSHSRYGSVKGYGYATKKCVCYTNGSGCDCSSQNEGYAIRNLATYGPAVVCLDASTWQDYSSGIITSDSGCGSGFMDVNHCVQAVGYAFYEEGEEAGGAGDSHDNHNSGDNKEGSGDGGQRDNGQRDGYWIIKNQWSTYWGMNGYAYVSMGANTCGVLNDMVQVYT